VLFESETKAVIELASLHAFTPAHLSFLELLTQSIGVVLNTIEANMRTDGLLKQSQELTVQLQTRQSELQKTNQELAYKAKQLADQNAEVERKNNEVEQARHALEEKAAELALTSKYKSEFLANMSHELRTPLNSILILGQQLTNNAGGNLTDKQVEWAKNVHSAGSELLNLINDILDLSKIESGTVTVDAEEITFLSIHDTIERNFRHVAESRNLPFELKFDVQLPLKLTVDSKRLQQILKNLLSNAFKFTHQGQVSTRVFVALSGWNTANSILNRAPQVVAFEVSDTGIGIAPDKQRLIFEAFQQADASTSRKYGGTGLGLAISRELSVLLGGEIRLSSTPNVGSTFTLFLPLHYTGPAGARPIANRNDATPQAIAPSLTVTAPPIEKVADDADNLQPGDRTLLIVEDDARYARHLLALARSKGFKVLVAPRGQVGLSLAREIQPAAIFLDVFLPDMLGWTVLNNLKHDPGTRHIPVQIMSVEEERMLGLDRGAFNFLWKATELKHLEATFDRLLEFLQPHTKRLLVVEDDATERQAVMDLLGHSDIEIVGVATGTDALAALLDRPFECVVLDLRLPDMSGFELLEKIQAEPALHAIPVVVFTGKDLTSAEEARLNRTAKSIVLKDVRSPERLLDETALFLHRSITDLPEEKQKIIDRLHRSNEILRGRKVLIVDDDARNIYALAIVLEGESMEILSATNGRQAIEIIRRTPDLAVVLMDIMMPEMDGFETMREIRKDARYRALPILAVTAKAMKGDRERCLEAGASDYIAKPVDTEHLLSLLRIWLYR
jgi:CheY-like chemotaxis protein/signal transduction histidine kinase